MPEGTCEKIVEKKGDYVLCVKGNQGSLHEDVAWFLDESEDFKDVEHTSYESVEKDHGRIEIQEVLGGRRRSRVAGIRRGVEGAKDHSSRAERIIWGQSSSQARHYISSLPGDAKRIADAVREHWAIENSLHWVLDVTLGEDRSRTRKESAPENPATLRRIAST